MEVLQKILSDKELVEKIAQLSLEEFKAELTARNLDTANAEKFYQMIRASQASSGELSDDDLDNVSGGGTFDGNNVGWCYGLCSRCTGKCFVMQIDYQNIVACSSCGHWWPF